MKRSLKHLPGSLFRGFGIILLAILVAVLARKYFFSALGTRIVWVTFYPAVVIASLYGGWLIGLFASGASCLIALYGWQLMADRPFIVDNGDRLGMVAFLLNCAMIAIVAEAARRERARAVKAKEQAEKAKELAETANRAKSVFLANMSHELRTPLNAILGFSSLMRNEESATEDQRRTLDIINRSGGHLLELINNVLDMAKIEAGQNSLEPRTFNPWEMIRDVADLLCQRAEAKGLTLKIDRSPDLPRMISADEVKMRQVVLNLVGNAIKFTSQGGVTLRLSSRQLNKPNRVLLIIEVQDTGQGIDPVDQKIIFEPFVQIGGVSVQKGTGLGLTITRQFVELMGGAIHVESERGRGATFRVETPVELAIAVDRPVGNANETRLARLAPGQQEYKILVVEDQMENSHLLRQIIEKAGLQARVADDGAQGLELFQSWRPHFIWMDWRMPVMDGLEATQRIRKLEGGREVKIAALSASVFNEDRERILASGADDFVAKPIRFDKIYDCMARHLGLRFIYDEPAKQTGLESSKELTAEAFETLPSSLRAELVEALVSLDADRIEVSISRIAAFDAGLGAVLNRYARQLKYTMILQVLRSCQK